MQQTAVPRMLAARVIAGSASPDAMIVTIDQGIAAGVSKNMAVISAQGVVGRVIDAGHSTSVQLLIHRQASASVKFERTGVGAGNAGRGRQSAMRLEQIPNLRCPPWRARVDVRPGRHYPAGFTPWAPLRRWS